MLQSLVTRTRHRDWQRPQHTVSASFDTATLAAACAGNLSSYSLRRLGGSRVSSVRGTASASGTQNRLGTLSSDLVTFET